VKSTTKNKLSVVNVKNKARHGYLVPFDTNRLAWCRALGFPVCCVTIAPFLLLLAHLFSLLPLLFSLFSPLSFFFALALVRLSIFFYLLSPSIVPLVVCKSRKQVWAT
jgi:hypothetical protein